MRKDSLFGSQKYHVRALATWPPPPSLVVMNSASIDFHVLQLIFSLLSCVCSLVCLQMTVCLSLYASLVFLSYCLSFLKACLYFCSSVCLCGSLPLFGCLSQYVSILLCRSPGLSVGATQLLCLSISSVTSGPRHADWPRVPAMLVTLAERAVVF